jgi:hypothetical protein
MKKSIIIALTGVRGAGKDYVADNLNNIFCENPLNVVARFSFASIIVDIASKLYNLPPEIFTDPNTKDAPLFDSIREHAFLPDQANITPRWLLHCASDSVQAQKGRVTYDAVRLRLNSLEKHSEGKQGIMIISDYRRSRTNNFNGVWGDYTEEDFLDEYRHVSIRVENKIEANIAAIPECPWYYGVPSSDTHLVYWNQRNQDNFYNLADNIMNQIKLSEEFQTHQLNQNQTEPEGTWSHKNE